MIGIGRRKRRQATDQSCDDSEQHRGRNLEGEFVGVGSYSGFGPSALGLANQSPPFCIARFVSFSSSSAFLFSLLCLLRGYTPSRRFKLGCDPFADCADATDRKRRLCPLRCWNSMRGKTSSRNVRDGVAISESRAAPQCWLVFGVNVAAWHAI